MKGLSARGIDFGYSATTRTIEGWSADFTPGEVVAITGPSGRGKSTLLYLLGLMLQPSGGEIRIDGESVSDLSDRARSALRARHFGFVFQDAALDASRTVLDNILESALYRGVDRRQEAPRAEQLMERFGVALRSTAKPGQVSGGQAQRIALCRALLAKPAILLADEPTGNLDPTTSGVVVDALVDHARDGAVVVVVTHEPSVVERCDRSIVL
jgi:ABC-type lipoprotein export system ATPase subunit